MASLSPRSSLHLRHLRGRVGDLIYKWYGDRLVITKVPKRSKKKPTAKKRASCNHFSLASDYAEESRENPVLWAVYVAAAKPRRIPPRSMAIADFRARPKIDRLSAHLFEPKLVVSVSVIEPFRGKINALEVVLRDAAGKRLLSAPAKRGGKRSWSVELGPVKRDMPVIIEVNAADRLGQTGRAQFSTRTGDRTVVRLPDEAQG